MHSNITHSFARAATILFPVFLLAAADAPFLEAKRSDPSALSASVNDLTKHISANPAQIPDGMRAEFQRPERPFLLMNKEEIAAAREKARTQPWAREALSKLLEGADKIAGELTLFPKEESGWAHWYVCPKSGTHLEFNPKQPHDHYCPVCKTTHQGELLDAAWLYFVQQNAASEQGELATAWLLTGDMKYAGAMKRFFLDLALKYPAYRLHDRSRVNYGDKAGAIAGIASDQSISECDLLTSLAFSYDTVAGSGALSKAEQQQIEEGVWKRGRDYMRRIMRLHPSGGNWWIWHASGATVLGVAFGDKELVDIGLNMPVCGLLPMLRGSESKNGAGYINDNGFTAELSPGYQYYPLKAFCRTAMATKRVGSDFYKIPVFKKLFDLPIAIRLPNLHLPRLNDGREVILNSEWAGLYELACHWFPDPAYQQVLSAMVNTPSLNLKRGCSSGVSDNIGFNYALLYGPPTLDPSPMDSTQSKLLHASGLALLRSPHNDWNCLLKDDSAASGAGHHHPDALNLILFANGEDAFPGTGTTGYGHYSYLQWYCQTVAHNTITINTKSQRITPDGKQIQFGISSFGVAAVQSVAEKLQGKTDEEECPERLRRTLVMTPHGIVDIFRTETDETRVAGLKTKPPVNLLDWTLHLYGKLTLDGKLEPSTDALISNVRLEAGTKHHDILHQGYKFITDLQRVIATDVPIHGRLTQPGGGKVDLWLAPSPVGGKVYQALGLGLETNADEKMPMLLQRRSANDTVFAAVYAPFKDQPSVCSVRFVKLSQDGREAAVELSQGDGKDLVLSLANPGSFNAAGAELEGTLGCQVEFGKKAGQWILVGTRWSDSEITLSLPKSGMIVVEKNASGIRLHNGTDNPVAGELLIKSLNAKIPFALEANETRQMPLP